MRGILEMTNNVVKPIKIMNLKFTSGLLLVLILISFTTLSQEKPADTVIVPLAETSKIIFIIRDRDDLEVLRHYNFQALFDDILDRLEESEISEMDSGQHTDNTAGEDWDVTSRDEDADDDDRIDDNGGDSDDENKWSKSRRGKIGQTWQSYNVDLGTNNYLADDQFPNGSEPYAVRPWGSWYVAGNSVQRTRLGRNLFVEWGLGVSWYNFKFQEDNILMQKDELGVRFEADNRDVDYIKSKLSATFINASLVPVLDFGDHSRKRRMWDGQGSSGFRQSC